MENNKQFAEGVWFEKRQGSPDFVIGSLNVKVPDFIPFLEKHRNNAGYVHLDIKMAKSGKPYIELNLWKPTKDVANVEEENQAKLNNFVNEPLIDPADGRDLSGEFPF